MPYSRLTVALYVAALAGAEPPSTISGDYIEGRSNHVYGCYCEWSGESVTGGKEATLAWRIVSGEWESVDLSGLKIAAVVVGEDTLSRGNPARRSTMFFDSRSTEAQRRAGERWLRSGYGAFLGEVIGVYSEPIDLERGPERATLRVGKLLDLTLRKAKLPEDALQGAILWYDPFIPLAESTLGTTLKNRYWGGDFDNRWDRSEPAVTGYFGRFSTGLRETGNVAESP